MRKLKKIALLIKHTCVGAFNGALDSAAYGGVPIKQDLRKLYELRNANRKSKKINKIDAVLLGNGPSVRIEDLDKLEELGATVFACNRFHLCYGETKLRPSFTIMSDKQVIADFGQEIIDNASGIVIVHHASRPNLKGDFIWIKNNPDSLCFSKSPVSGFAPMGGALLTASQLALFLGYSRQFLYGVDHSFTWDKVKDAEDKFFSAQGDNNHFIKGYRSGKKWCPPSTANIETGFMMCKVMLNSNMYNMSRTSKLPYIDKIAFNDFVSMVST